MSDAPFVQEGQSPCEVMNDGRSLVLGEVNSLLDLRQQRPAVGLLEDEVKVVLVFEEVLQLDDLELTAAEVVEFDFLHDFSTRERGGALADGLDGELVAGQPGDAGFNPAIAALAQDLALKRIGFFESVCRESEMNN